MFLSPDGKPLVGGTYFPPRDRDGRSGLLGILKLIDQRWTADPCTFSENGRPIGRIRPRQSGLSSRRAAHQARACNARRRPAALADQYDRQYGGFGYSADNPSRPKFPEPPNLEFLLDRAGRTHDTAAREMLLGTLDKMAAGGIRDHLGGGFHRYSTDRYWRVPHFEKMLYDNSQLVAVYARGSSSTIVIHIASLPTKRWPLSSAS